MVIDKKGEAFEYEGRKYVIGEKVIATAASDYSGLIGVITEIRDGEDKDTDNETPDIYCAFEKPTSAREVKRLEKLFSELYGEPKTIEDIGLDEIIMAPDMISTLAEIRRRK